MRLWQSWSLRQPQGDPVTETNSLLLPRRNENPDFGSGTVFFVGNATVLIHERLREIPRRFPHVDLALLHLGGTRVLGIIVTMDAQQGVEAMRIVDPRSAIPIHYNDYEAFESPLEDFKRAVNEAGLEDRVHHLSHGDTYEFEVPGAGTGV
jgi:L-ascorbate metabolism protein UlaG (beta-lactamase superfamily)